MKTKLILVITLLFGLFIKLNAQSNENFTNEVRENKEGQPIMIISYTSDFGISVPHMKTEYSYADGYRVGRSLFLWNKSKSSWDPVSKTEYRYNDQGKLISSTIYKKENRSNGWSNIPETMYYRYDKQGELLTVDVNTDTIFHRDSLTKK